MSSLPRWHARTETMTVGHCARPLPILWFCFASGTQQVCHHAQVKKIASKGNSREARHAFYQVHARESRIRVPHYLRSRQARFQNCGSCQQLQSHIREV